MATELGGGGHGGAELRFGGKKEPGADKERASERRALRIRMRAKRGWPARGTKLAGAVATRARRTEQREGEEADGWARARKRKETSLKFKTKVFPSSKIHQIFTGDR